jgi:transcriptional regulator with XRE-family HTH domain
MHQIGEKIKLLRELQNMKQDELAFHLDISPPALSDI